MDKGTSWTQSVLSTYCKSFYSHPRAIGWNWSRPERVMLKLILMVLCSLQGLVPLLEALLETLMRCGNVVSQWQLEKVQYFKWKQGQYLMGFALAWDKGFQKLDLECDNALLIEIILVGGAADSRQIELRLIHNMLIRRW